ncbi:hypothetical protein E4U53_002302 [Claviceps sorghi]|nr:hypothetical protein E4U53_002302 [Claviceps sorghi]
MRRHATESNKSPVLGLETLRHESSPFFVFPTASCLLGVIVYHGDAIYASTSTYAIGLETPSSAQVPLNSTPSTSAYDVSSRTPGGHNEVHGDADTLQALRYGDHSARDAETPRSPFNKKCWRGGGPRIPAGAKYHLEFE